MKQVLKSLLFLAVGAVIVFALFAAVMSWGTDFALPALFLCFAAIFGILAKAIWEGSHE